MTTKEYLSQIYYADQKIGRLQRRRDALRARLYSSGSVSGQLNADRVQESLSDDRILKLIAQVDELECDIVDEIARLRKLQHRIAGEIEQVEDDRYRTILHDRYVLCRRWEDIARTMGVDKRWLFRLHGRALQDFGKKLKLTI